MTIHFTDHFQRVFFVGATITYWTRWARHYTLDLTARQPDRSFSLQTKRGIRKDVLKPTCPTKAYFTAHDNANLRCILLNFTYSGCHFIHIP